MEENKKSLTYDDLITLFDKIGERMKERDKEADARDKEAQERSRDFDERLKKSQEENEKRKAEIDALFKKSQEEDARRKVEADARSAEADKRIAEINALFKKSQEEDARRKVEADARSAEFDARFKKSQEDYEKRSAKADKTMEELKMEVSGISKNNGHHAENFFQQAFEKKKEFAGIKFDKMIKNLKRDGKKNCEFDIVLLNGNSVAIIEVKHRIHPNFAEEMATKKVAQFRKHFPQYKDYAVYLGIAGFSFDDSVIEKAKDYGIGLVRQDGKTIVLDNMPTKIY